MQNTHNFVFYIVHIENDLLDNYYGDPIVSNQDFIVSSAKISDD